MTRRSLLGAAPVLLSLAAFFWATNAIVGKIAAQSGIPPIGFAFWRWALAIVLILPLTGRSLWEHRAVLRRDGPFLLLLGALSAGAYNALMYAALATSTAINVSLVGASMPIMMVVLARLVLKDRLGKRQMAGIALSFLGVLLVVAQGDLQVLASLTLHEGDALMLLATFLWSVFSVLLRRHPPAVPATTFLTVQMVGGLLILVPFYAWEILAGRTMPLDATTAWVLPYTAVFPALLAFLFWNKGLAAVGPGVAGLYSNLIPVLTAVMAVGLLGETLSWFHACAMVLILGGIALVSRRPR
ncbi:DMT family transporter [Pararhodospirillum photometricum]|nr:DMT family transporter [Pararhodospirillum photometricum]